MSEFAVFGPHIGKLFCSLIIIFFDAVFYLSETVLEETYHIIDTISALHGRGFLISEFLSLLEHIGLFLGFGLKAFFFDEKQEIWIIHLPGIFPQDMLAIIIYICEITGQGDGMIAIMFERIEIMIGRRLLDIGIFADA